MAIARPALGIVSIVLLGTGILFQFFIILSGYVNVTPFNNTYFLQASTRGIQDAQDPSRWTYLALCGVDNGVNANCGSTQPAFPFAPASQFGSGVDQTFSDQYNKFFYLSRFSSVFFLIALFFSAMAFLVSLLALCSRLGAYLTGSTVSLAFFFQALAAALMTAWSVIGRNTFRSIGQDASLGKYAYGFTWASVACFFISMILFCVGGSVSNGSSNKKGMFGRKRSTRSRGSFIDNESGRRVKDEYD